MRIQRDQEARAQRSEDRTVQTHNQTQELNRLKIESARKGHERALTTEITEEHEAESILQKLEAFNSSDIDPETGVWRPEDGFAPLDDHGNEMPQEYNPEGLTLIEDGGMFRDRAMVVDQISGNKLLEHPEHGSRIRGGLDKAKRALAAHGTRRNQAINQRFLELRTKLSHTATHTSMDELNKTMEEFGYLNGVLMQGPDGKFVTGADEIDKVRKFYQDAIQTNIKNEQAITLSNNKLDTAYDANQIRRDKLAEEARQFDATLEQTKAEARQENSKHLKGSKGIFMDIMNSDPNGGALVMQQHQEVEDDLEDFQIVIDYLKDPANRGIIDTWTAGTTRAKAQRFLNLKANMGTDMPEEMAMLKGTLVDEWVKTASGLKGALSERETAQINKGMPSGTWSTAAWVQWLEEKRDRIARIKASKSMVGWWWPTEKTTIKWEGEAGSSAVIDVLYNTTPGVAPGTEVNINAFLGTPTPTTPEVDPFAPDTPAAPEVDPFAPDTPAAPTTPEVDPFAPDTPAGRLLGSPVVPEWLGDESGITIRGRTTYKREGKDGVYIVLDNGDVLYQQYFHSNTGQLLRKGKDPDVDGDWEPLTDISTLY
jgi:hypothetical protein